MAAILFALAIALIAMAGVTLSTLWADYKDSADSVYLTVATVELFLALPFVAGGVWVLRNR